MMVYGKSHVDYLAGKKKVKRKKSGKSCHQALTKFIVSAIFTTNFQKI